MKQFHFRKYKTAQGKKKVRHPKLIVDEYGNEYGFMGLTSSKYKGRGHKNIPLVHNPQIVNGKRKAEKSYLRRKVEYDRKNNFGEIRSDYVISKEDIKRLTTYVNKHKKKR